MNRFKRLQILTLLTTGLLTANACTTSKLPKALPTVKASTNPITATTTTYHIVNAVITYASATAAGTTSISLDSTKSSGQLTQSCNAPIGGGTATMPCACVYSWEEINTTTGSSIPIKRSVQGRMTQVQPFSATCVAPNPTVWTTEVQDGTTVRITLVPASGSTTSFTTNTYNYIKTSNVPAGTFQDSQGHFFDNILRYTCYEQFKRGTSITSKMHRMTNPGTTPELSGREIRVPMASQYCVKKANAGSSNSTTGCENLGPIENSAQAYYYNLYVRDSERGSINVWNQRYYCPRVEEFLSGGSGSLANAWPLDTSFALSLGKTTEFTVGVEAFTKLSNGTDAGSRNSTCYVPEDGGQTQVTANANSLVSSCLGFAAPVNKDGTCPTFKDKNQMTRQTYRLRRFIVLYPQVFDTNGDWINQAQATDTVYVLDRPVRSTTNNSPTAKPFTMRGPKPCPFAFFDKKGVIGLQATRLNEYKNDVIPTYAATNNVGWAGTNIDGIEFPNSDGLNSCSAALPVFNSSKSLMSMTTVNAANPVYKRVYVRPIQPWAPHYVEDTDFLACAPAPDPDFRDPPLHFAKDPTTGNVGWCAEVYPTQNNNIAQLDQRNGGTGPFFGSVAPYTSHVVKNSLSQSCTPRIPSTIPAGTAYPDATPNAACPDVNAPLVLNALARHPADYVVDRDVKANGAGIELLCANQTCDRTVVNPTGGTTTWPQFPLLASAHWTEQAIINDSTYGCTITYDAGGGKAGVSSPTEGCCGAAVKMTTGYSAANGNIHQNLGAHLEPDVRCQVPSY